MGGGGGPDPQPIRISNITNKFYNNGQKVTGISFTLYVKQAVFGFRFMKAWFSKDNLVGHTFIGITVTYADNSTITQKFGFYPQGKGGDYFEPQAEGGTFKDNGNPDHSYSEGITKSISISEYNSIMQVAKITEMVPYNLVTNNCTTFGRVAATLAGIKIDGTGNIPVAGQLHIMPDWKYGYANPGDLGQDILEGKYTSTDGAAITSSINSPDKPPYNPYDY